MTNTFSKLLSVKELNEDEIFSMVGYWKREVRVNDETITLIIAEDKKGRYCLAKGAPKIEVLKDAANLSDIVSTYNNYVSQLQAYDLQFETSDRVMVRRIG